MSIIDGNKDKAQEDELNNLRLLSLNEARKILRIRYKTLTDLIKHEKIKVHKINGRVRVPVLSLKKFINDTEKVREQITLNHTEKVNNIILKNSNKIWHHYIKEEVPGI